MMGPENPHSEQRSASFNTRDQEALCNPGFGGYFPGYYDNCVNYDESDSSLPVTIDLTSPVPVINVPKHDRLSRNFNKIIKAAPQCPANLKPTVQIISQKIEEDSSSSYADISDINPKLWTAGKEFIKRNFFSLIFAHLIGIAFLLAVKPIQSLLLRTAAIHKKENTLKRYLSVIMSLKNLYECDLLSEVHEEGTSNNFSFLCSGHNTDNASIISYKFNHESTTFEELKTIKRVLSKMAKNFRVYAPPPNYMMKLDEEEKLLLKQVKEDLKDLDGDAKLEMKQAADKIFTTVNPDVPVSQYDLIMMQFTFFAIVSLFPKVFGIWNEKKFPDGLKGFVHIWGVFGRRLGLEDQFNLCIEKNYDPELNSKIFREVFVFSLRNADENLMKLWRSMTNKSRKYFFFFRTKALICFMISEVSSVIERGNLYTIMNHFEKFSYHYYRFFVKWVLRVPIFKNIINFTVKTWLIIMKTLYLDKLKKDRFFYNPELVSTVS